MKKILTSLIILSLIISSFGIIAFADETPAFTITYSDETAATTANTFADAATLANKKTDGTLVTITMNKDCTDSTNYTYTSSTKRPTFTKTNVLLDLGGYTLTRDVSNADRANGAISIAEGKLEITNGTIDQTGSGNYALWSSPLITSGKTSELYVHDVTIKSVAGAITTGSDGDPNGYAVITVGEGTVIDCAGTAFYANKRNCTYNITGGLIQSSVAQGGNVPVAGKIFQVQSPASINISGGTFENTTCPNPVDFYCVGGGKTFGTVKITGGTFSADPSMYCQSGYYANKLSSNEYVVEKTVTVAAIKEDVVSDRKATSSTANTYVTGDVAYKTLAYAVADDVNDTDVADGFVAPQSTVIKLMANNNEKIEISKELTITKNGFEATSLSAGAGYALNETDSAYIVTRINEVEEALGTAYEDGNGTKTARFFAPIDSINYAEAGFEVTTKIDEIEYSWIIKLYEIYSNVVVNNATYGAENYMFSGAIGEIPADTSATLTVTPYTMNFEGEKSYSTAVTVTVE